MGKMHINERGTHTTVIEGAAGILKALRKIGVETAPGVIEANVGARGKSAKLKRLNDATFELVVVVNGSKQTFKLYGKDQDGVEGVMRDTRRDSWNVQETMDLSL
jgi:hypothetical protein